MTRVPKTSPRATLVPALGRALTHTERRFLERIADLQQQPDAQIGVYLTTLTPRRSVLIVRTPVGSYELDGRHVKNRSQIEKLEKANLIAFGTLENLPEPFAPGGSGRPITVTEAGLNAL